MLYPVFLAQNPMVTCVLAKHNFLEKVVIFKVDACICVYVAVYLNGSMTNNTVRNFLVFIVYAKNSVTRYPNLMAGLLQEICPQEWRKLIAALFM